MLRFLGVRDFEIYELSSKEIKEILAKYRQTTTSTVTAAGGEKTEVVMDQDVKEEKETICTACVGTVQYAGAFVKEIVDRMQKEAYVTKTFNMNVTLPTSTLIRNHAMAIYWNQKLSSYPTAQVDIKEIFKLLISWPIERQTGLTLDFGSELRMQVAVKHEETKDDHVFLSKMKESGLIIKTKRENRKTIVVGDGRHHVVKALTMVKDHRFSSCGHVPPIPVSSRPQLESIEMMRESVFVGGRYLKYTRDVSQTPWSIGTTMLAELSVSGIVCETLKNAFHADEGEVNTIMPDKVQIRHLAALRPEDTKVIKDGEETKTKSYSALCWTSKPVTQAMIDAVNEYNGKAFYVEQQTPIRVLQRRAQMIRKKEIHSLKAFPLEGHFMVVHLHTEAGTYIKEFVHGDLGRNQPSLASIIDCEADIMELDVLEVDLEFPPPECLP
ncbi:putative tRNA pseudouridine synthase Pus10 [Linnemannia schmuckeri]|uniref:tRNA pseudouridine(55) synthase n=1 Tax=Linnemannia schmuckeri TaxID=64567 RepID=A0A9P5RZH7_9FUNG|nr:putative tRNA pseudouridine synthase Pus10 [Linnemannia schmuckeri]